jgi:hypothetical protein
MEPMEFHWLEAPTEDGEVMVVHGVLAHDKKQDQD